MKKAGIFLLCVFVITLALLVSSVSPERNNILSVSTYHEYVDGTAHCKVEIRSFSETTLIDNVSIEFCYLDNGLWIIFKRWEDVQVDCTKFDFFETVSGVNLGETYRLKVSADIHRGGVVESVSFDHDVKY